MTAAEQLIDSMVGKAEKEVKPTNEAYLSHNQIWDAYEEMKEQMGAEQLLEEMARQMSSDELRGALEYIAQQWDMKVTGIRGDDEDEEEDDEEEEEPS
jgi:Cu/Ag efflux pump CusA